MGVVTSARRAVRLFRRGLAGMGRSWSLALLSLALSTTLWVFVTDQENPPRTDVLGARIAVRAVNVPEGLALAGGSLGTVSIRISAREDLFSDLDAGDFRAVVDLANALPGTNEVSVEAEVDDRLSDDVAIVAVSPSSVTVTLVTLVSQTVPVRVNITGDPPIGFEAEDPVVDPVQVTVSGPDALVRQVAQVEADVNLAGATVSLTRTFQLEPRTASGSTIDGVTLDPDSALVNVNIQQTVFERLITVRPSVAGSVASGYQVTGIEASPPQVLVVGTLEALQALLFVETEEVDVGGAASDVTRTALLRLPPDVSAPGQPSVVVTVSVAAARGEAEYGKVPQVTGLANDLRAVVNTPTVTLRVQGPLPALRALRLRDITVSVNGAGLGPGVYSLRPDIQLPPGIELVSYTPTEVTVTVSRR